MALQQTGEQLIGEVFHLRVHLFNVHTFSLNSDCHGIFVIDGVVQSATSQWGHHSQKVDVHKKVCLVYNVAPLEFNERQQRYWHLRCGGLPVLQGAWRAAQRGDRPD